MEVQMQKDTLKPIVTWKKCLPHLSKLGKSITSPRSKHRELNAEKTLR